MLRPVVSSSEQTCKSVENGLPKTTGRDSSTPASAGASLISETSLLIADTAGYAQRPGPVDQVRSASSNNAAGSTESAALRISMPAKRP